MKAILLYIAINLGELLNVFVFVKESSLVYINERVWLNARIVK